MVFGINVCKSGEAAVVVHTKWFGINSIKKKFFHVWFDLIALLHVVCHTVNNSIVSGMNSYSLPLSEF